MRINIDLRGLNRSLRDLDAFEADKLQRIKDITNEHGLNILTEAKKRASGRNGGPNVQTGRLRSSIRMQPLNEGYTMKVGTNVEYAKDVEFGTGPHIIRPKNKKALYWRGARHPVKLVRHPGSRAKPFLFPAWEQERPKFIRALREALSE